MAAGEVLEGTAAPGEQDVLDDPVLEPFLNEGFKHNEYASSVLRNPKIVASERTQMLQSSIAKLDAGIRSEVTAKQDALLGHARQLQVSDRSLQGIKGTITSFYEDLKQLKNEAQAPYSVLVQRSTELHNLHATLQLLRSVNTRLKQTNKLHQVMRSSEKIEPMDLAKAAKLLWEIETAAEATDFSGVTVVDQCAPALSSALLPTAHITSDKPDSQGMDLFCRTKALASPMPCMHLCTTAPAPDPMWFHRKMERMIRYMPVFQWHLQLS